MPKTTMKQMIPRISSEEVGQIGVVVKELARVMVPTLP
jgi:hypothetical protein